MTEQAKTEVDEDLARLEDLIDGKVRDGLTEAQIDAKIAAAISNANKEEVLWRNQSPAEVFAAQTVSWNTDEYNRVYVVYNNWHGDGDNLRQTSILYPGKPTTLIFAYQNSSEGVMAKTRSATFSSDKKSVTFGAGKINQNQSDANGNVIPLYIVGFKSTIDF